MAKKKIRESKKKKKKIKVVVETRTRRPIFWRFFRAREPEERRGMNESISPRAASLRN